MAAEAAAKLRKLMADGEFILAPGVYDMISARIADRMGFNALYMTGYGVTFSYLGLPDAGLATYSDMLNRASTIAGGTVTPLIADADTGYGGLLNVRHTVRGYEAAGVAAIQLEDQEIPKKCGHADGGRAVVPIEEMVQKIEVAAEARRDPDTLIIGRTDARSVHGLDDAIARAKAYVKAGADIAFVEAPRSEEEMERIGQEVDAPLLANMVTNGRTPMLPAERLKELGYNIAIYPGLGMNAAAAAVRDSLTYLKTNGSAIGINVPVFGFGSGEGESIHELAGFPDVWEFEKRWGLR